MPKALKEWQAYEDLRKTIDDFNETCPLLELMANKAMQSRHWDRIAKITGHVFDIESDSFLLRNLMEAPLLKYKEDIEVGVGCSIVIRSSTLNSKMLISTVIFEQSKVSPLLHFYITLKKIMMVLCVNSNVLL